ncbi:hypothetical protein NP570_25000, partial [Vibrio parahaemolyticus]|nr:hypothetical protein [Vibrio parahaemolyticus]
VIELYKALGGGWQAQTVKTILEESIAKQKQDRTDWDGYLDEENRTLTPLHIETQTENGDKKKTEDL